MDVNSDGSDYIILYWNKLQKCLGIEESQNDVDLRLKRDREKFIELKDPFAECGEITVRIKLKQDTATKKLEIVSDTSVNMTGTIVEIKNKEGKITYIDSRQLLAYLAAEQRTYMFKGEKENLREALPAWLGGPGNDTQREGMIYFINNNAREKNVSIDRAERKLNVENKVGDPGVIIKELSYSYGLEGWTGKYGKPIELSLAMHLATMSPEFTYKFVTDERLETQVDMDFESVTCPMRLFFNTKENLGKDAQTTEGESIASIIETKIRDYRSYGTEYNRTMYEEYSLGSFNYILALGNELLFRCT